MKNSTLVFALIWFASLGMLQAGDAPSPEDPNTVRIARFKGDRMTAVSITLDDNLRNQNDFAVPLLDQFGIKATFFVIPGLTPETDEEAAKKKPDEWGGISWMQLKKLAKAGHEIASHTWTHEPVITTKDGQRINMEPAKLEAQIAMAHEAITQQIGVAPFSFASPGNAIDQTVRAAARKFHPVIRDKCERFGSRSPSSQDFTAEQANALVERFIARREPLVWMLHGITEGYNALSSDSVLADHLKFLKSREDVLWIDTYANVRRYAMERDAAELKILTSSGNNVTFTLNCPLDPVQFQDPLTVVIPAQNAAEVTARGEVSGRSLRAEVQPGRILIQAAPSTEPVEVTWKSGTTVSAAKPVSPNTWIRAETDRADAVYKCGEKAVFRVFLAKNAPSAPAECAWALTLDGAMLVQQGTLRLESGSASVEGTLKQPGVLRLTVTPTSGAETLGTGMAGAAFDPYQIKPTATFPSDFEQFWKAQVAELSEIPLDPIIQPVAQDDPDIELFEVSFANIQGLRSHGYLAKLKGATSLPAMISQPGMGAHPNGLKEARWVISNASLGFLALDMSAHDLPLERTAEGEAKWKKIMGYPYMGSDDRMTYYYRHVFTGLVRAVDFITAHPDWNHKAIVSSGASQGGGLALIAAALDPRITAVVSVAPALGEHTGPLFGRPDAAPANLIMGRDKKTPDPAIVAATAYYDTVNFARFVRVPVLMSSGLIDPACPPMTVLSIFNTLEGPKQLDLVPLLGHNQGPRFAELRNQFLVIKPSKNLPNSKNIDTSNLGAPIERK